MTRRKLKALVLFSGGLDSRLCVKLLQDQKIDLETVFFKLPFGGGCCNNFACVLNYSQVQGVRLHVLDCTSGKLFREFINVIKYPKHGTGTAINPCKDCKIFMLKKAKLLAEEIKADLIVTGEVLGQRPMSQFKKDLALSEKQSGLKGKILRPLSAKLLPITEFEKQGLIERDKLLDIQGRSRKIQIQLAKKYKIKFPGSGGGCLLCEKPFARRLKDLFESKKNILPEDIELLKVGRHFKDSGKIVLGKNKQENDVLEDLNKKLNFNLIIPKTPGPTAVFENLEDKPLVVKLINAYSKNPRLRKQSEKFIL